MGFYEFGQSIVAMVVIVVIMLVAFGGFQNQSLVQPYFPGDGSFNGPNDINNALNDKTSTLSGTPYAETTPTSTSTKNNDPFQNLSFGYLTQAFNLITVLPFAALDALSFIGLPSQIVYVIGSIILVFGGIFLLFFLVNVGGSLFGRGGSA